MLQRADAAGAFLLAGTAISAPLGAAQCSLLSAAETFVTLRIRVKPPSLKKKSVKARFHKVNTVDRALALHKVQLLEDLQAVST